MFKKIISCVVSILIFSSLLATNVSAESPEILASVTGKYKDNNGGVSTEDITVSVEVGVVVNADIFVQEQHGGETYKIDSYTIERTPATDIPYIINYYKDSISSNNLLGTVSGTGTLGVSIDVELDLFAPNGYITPGIRSGSETIQASNNVVDVVYLQGQPVMLSYVIEYYKDQIDPGSLLETVPSVGVVEQGTLVTLSVEQLDAYKPDYYQSGNQVDGSVAIVLDSQIIKVLYLPLPQRQVTIRHYTQTNYGSDSYSLFKTTSTLAYEGEVLEASSFIEYLGSRYSYAFATPASLTVGPSNVMNLYYDMIRTRSTIPNEIGNNEPEKVIIQNTRQSRVPIDTSDDFGTVRIYNVDVNDQIIFAEGYIYVVKIEYSLSNTKKDETPSVPATGDHSTIYSYVAVVACFAFGVGIAMKRRKQKANG